MLARRTFSAKMITQRIRKLVVYTTVHPKYYNYLACWCIIHRFSRIEEKINIRTWRSIRRSITTTLVAMSNTAVHKNLVAAQLPVTNCISGYGQPIVLQYFVWFPREWLRGFWNFASSSSTRLRSLAKSLSKETWLSCIIIEISASASSRRSVRKMKGYLWILNFRQRRSLCISAAQHLPSQLNGRGQR